MFHRLISTSKTHSFFIFGARGTGKSTYLSTQVRTARSFSIDLLTEADEERYGRSPDRLAADLKSLPEKPDWVIIDEIQKVPKLLDLVHKLIEEEKLRFALTGSSARKLKRGQANLLAGRAFVYQSFPLTERELGKDFSLEQVLRWGALPKVMALASESDKRQFLRSYCHTYLKEEILQEQLVRNGEAFRDFLELAAQCNATSLSYSRIARDLGVDTKTVQSFFQILEDTLVAFRLPAYHRSVRKAQKAQPKFYLFDLGVKNALEHSLDAPPTPGTSAYGKAFEHFVICEVSRLNEYYQADYRLSHFQTSQGAEVDLILSRGKKTILVELKSSARVDEVEIRALARFGSAIAGAELYYVSQDPVASKVGDVSCLHWKEFLARIFPVS
ncbi:MAG: AAA family ATPase [Oligoflexia bacterium]|nr:AAA family ATPase [Oligoflexia bacterium]